MSTKKRKDKRLDFVLHLVLTYDWFDKMVAGRKDVEYRTRGGKWDLLIWDRREKITHARFSRGYTPTTILRRVIGVDIGVCPYEGWGGHYYRLHLGPIIVESATCAREERERGTGDDEFSRQARQ